MPADSEHSLNRIAVDVTLGLLYLGLCLYAFSALLPQGVNQTFSELTWDKAFAGAAVAFLLLCLRLSMTKSTLTLASFTNDRFSVYDLSLVLLPMTPVIQYVIANQDVLSVDDSVMSLGLFASLSLVLTILLPLLIGLIAARCSLMLVGLSVSFVVFNMGLLTAEYHWHKEGEIGVQVVVFLLVFGICAAVYRLNKTALYAAVAAYCVVNSTMIFFATDTKSAAAGTSTYAPGTEKNIQHTPDIFVLAYDSYVPNQTMQNYGIDNSAQELFLERQNFTLYDGTYSLGSSTIASMGQMFGGPDLRSSAGGHGDVHRVLTHYDYETHGIFQNDYFFRREGSAYHQSIPQQGRSYRNLALAILEGSFRFNIAFNKQPYSQFIDHKRRVLGAKDEKPKFVYSHTGPWHSQNSGTCLNDEVEQFEKRLVSTNVEMQEDIETVIAANPQAIIIINGDHGPYLTKNCYKLNEGNYAQGEISRKDVQDRFATFLAIRWPENSNPRHDEISILQDVFPVTFAYLFEDDGMLDMKLERTIAPRHRDTIAGLNIENGIIVGGANDGEPLFEPNSFDQTHKFSHRASELVR